MSCNRLCDLFDTGWFLNHTHSGEMGNEEGKYTDKQSISKQKESRKKNIKLTYLKGRIIKNEINTVKQHN